MQMKKIVALLGGKSELAVELNRRAEEYARSLGLEYRWAQIHPFSEEAVIAELLNADAGVIDIEPYGEPIFSRVKDSAKLLVRFGVGYDKVDLKAASEAGIAIARTTGANASAVAEMALTLMLSCKRRLNRSQSRIKSGSWGKDVGNEIIGGTVGIIGFGNIGRRLARLLSGFDCDILVYAPSLSEEAARAAGVERVSLEELFTRSDAISIHAPYTPETHHMVDGRLLSLMKPTALFINTARGPIVETAALAAALQNGTIAGAGVDVFDTEPPIDEANPLFAAPHLVCTPHVAFATHEAFQKRAVIVAENLAAWLSGAPQNLC